MTESTIHKAKRLFNQFMDEEKAQINTLYMVFFAAIIVLAIIIIFTFIPGIGSTVAQSTPTLPAYGQAGGEWNGTDSTNPNSAALNQSTGASIWVSTSGMLKVAIIIGIVVIILAALFGIFSSRRPGAGQGGAL